MSNQPGSNRPVWLSETSHPELSDKLKIALKQVVDPELGLDVIQLGLIRNVTIEENRAIVSMILTTPFFPYGPSMIESIRLKSEEALEKTVAIDLGLEPWDFSMMEEDLGEEWGLF
ncbi:MAG: iron-sulfur cluster assembly protein [Methanobacterium sp.]